MRQSWKIGRLAGTVIRVHLTFPLLLLWLAFAHLGDNSGWSAFGRDLAYTLLVFFVIVLHELGHVRMARRFGIRTRDITLLPIGGVAHLERLPEKPRQELAVALAGPAVNVVLAAGLAAVLLAIRGAAGWAPFGWNQPDLLVQLLWTNVALAAFNLLPAFPMDGGRVLRALLALRLDPVRATVIAALVGRGLAVLLGLAGVYGNPFLVLLAVFIWMGAGAEAGAARLRAALAGVPVRALMTEGTEVLPPDLPLGEAARRLLAGGGRPLVVGPGGLPERLVSSDALLAALTRFGPARSLGTAARHRFRAAEAEQPVTEALRLLEEDTQDFLPVLDDGRLVGFLTAGNLATYLRLHDVVGPSGR